MATSYPGSLLGAPPLAGAPSKEPGYEVGGIDIRVIGLIFNPAGLEGLHVWF